MQFVALKHNFQFEKDAVCFFSNDQKFSRIFLYINIFKRSQLNLDGGLIVPVLKVLVFDLK